MANENSQLAPASHAIGPANSARRSRPSSSTGRGSLFSSRAGDGRFTPTRATRDIGKKIHIVVPQDNAEPYAIHFGSKKCLASGKGGYDQKKDSVGTDLAGRTIRYKKVDLIPRGEATLNNGRSVIYGKKNSIYGDVPPVWLGQGSIQIHTLRSITDSTSPDVFQTQIFTKGCLATTPSCVEEINKFVKSSGGRVNWEKIEVPKVEWGQI